MNEPTIVTRRRALALLAAAPLAALALPAVAQAAPLAPSAGDVRATAWRAMGIEHETLSTYLGVPGKEFGDAFFRALIGFADRRDAYAAEHGAWTRSTWG